MATPTGATNYITITSTAAQVAASMPDVGSTFAADLVIDQAASINYEGGAETFIDGLAADYSDLRVTDSTGDITIPFGVKQFSQTAGSRKLIIGLGIPSTAPLLASGPVVYKLWRGATGGTAENRAGVAPTADGWVIYAPLSEQGPGTGTGTAVWRNWVTDTVTIKEYTTNTGKAGQVGAGQQFSGTGKATGPTIAWSTFSDYTIMCWFRLASDYSTYSQILGGTSWRPSISTDEAREINYWQSGGYTVAGIAVTSDVWHFAAVTHTTNVDSLIVDTTTQTVQAHGHTGRHGRPAVHRSRGWECGG